MAEIISETGIEKTKKLIKSSKKPIIILAQDENYNRKMLEYGNFDILLSPEIITGKSRVKQEDSGLNHVLAKIAAKNNISIGIDMDKISKLDKKDKAIRLAKIRQNIKICRRAKTKIKIINSGNKEEARAFLLSLGASTQQAKEAIS